MASGMGTNIEIDDRLLDEAMAVSGQPTVLAKPANNVMPVIDRRAASP